MQKFSFILSIAGLIPYILALLIKGKKINTTLLLNFSGSMLVTASYILAGSGINGAISSFVGGLQAIINYGFARKNKPIPFWLIGIYAAMYICANLAVLSAPIGILAIIASLTAVCCVSAKNGTQYRIWSNTNSVLWILYDILSKSYAPLITHSVLLFFGLAGMLINELYGEKKTQ